MVRIKIVHTPLIPLYRQWRNLIDNTIFGEVHEAVSENSCEGAGIVELSMPINNRGDFEAGAIEVRANGIRTNLCSKGE